MEAEAPMETQPLWWGVQGQNQGSDRAEKDRKRFDVFRRENGKDLVKDSKHGGIWSVLLVFLSRVTGW